jgi:hypothetical protein
VNFLPASPLGYNRGMDETPKPPWIACPGIMRKQSSTLRELKPVERWLQFLFALPADKLREYKRNYPPPAGWERIYDRAERQQEFRDIAKARRRQLELITKLWESTTLK